jgi:AAHS family 4-hydroxybenzoate transporter-like MFS transporter
MAASEGRGGGASLVDVDGASLVDVAEFIDQQPVGGFQIRLLLTCAAVLFPTASTPRPSAMSRPRLPGNGA